MFPRYEEPVNPHKVREDPSCRGVFDRSSCLIGKRRWLGIEGCADAKFQGGVPQQTHGHDHQEGHDPLRFFQIARRGEQERSFEKPNAAFYLRLAFIPCQECLRG